MSLMNYIEMEQSAYKQYTEEIKEIGKEEENERNNNKKIMKKIGTSKFLMRK